LTFLEEFKAFAFKGNVVDLAVGVIIGAASASSSIRWYKNCLLPAIGLLLPGEKGYVGWKIVSGSKEVPYGAFLGDLVNSCSWRWRCTSSCEVPRSGDAVEGDRPAAAH